MKYAALIAAAALMASPAVAQQGDWRTPDLENLWVIDTNQGRILVELSPQTAPAHVERIRTLTRQGFYDGLNFFRVVDGFMAQTGDPENAGTGQSALPDLEPEFTFRRGPGGFTKAAVAPPDYEAPSVTDLGFIGVMPVRSSPEMQMMVTADGKAPAWGLFCQGVAGMARAAPVNSANSQFFLMRDYKADLNLQYTPFGRVLSGLDVVRRIKVGEPVPQPQDRMTNVRIGADLPEAERPKIRVMDTRGAAFKALIDETKARRGSAFHICDIDIPVEIG